MELDFEITHDSNFLEHFLDKRETFKLPAGMVEKLRASNDPYALYGYGRWLYARRKDREALLTATRCFTMAAVNGVADAYHMLSKMCTNGHVVSEDNDLLMLDRELGNYYRSRAEAAGSLLAKLERNVEEFFAGDAAGKEKAINDAREEIGKESASILWMEQLGWFYATTGRNDKAIECYEKCVEEGWNYPIFDLAQIYYQRGNIAYHDSLMEEGIEKEVPLCMMFGCENQGVWDELSASQQEEIREQMSVNLRRGVELGCPECAYVLSFCLTEGLYDFERDLPAAVAYARKGMDLGSHMCCRHLISIMEEDETKKLLPQEMLMTDDEIMMTRLIALRYGDSDMLDDVIEHADEYRRMGYGDEIEKVWRPIWDEENREVEGYDIYDAKEEDDEYDTIGVC